jgi:hypothetical protein
MARGSAEQAGADPSTRIAARPYDHPRSTSITFRVETHSQRVSHHGRGWHARRDWVSALMDKTPNHWSGWL